MHVQPYVFFNGHCEDALAFDKRALGAEVMMLIRFKESPELPPPGMIPDGWDNKVMHSSFRIGETTLMASDGDSQGQSNFHGFSFSLAVQTEVEAARFFNALAEDGNKLSRSIVVSRSIITKEDCHEHNECSSNRHRNGRGKRSWLCHRRAVPRARG